MTSARTKWGVAVAAIAVLATTLSGCFLLPTDRPSSGEPTPAADAPFAAYFDQKVSWSKCGTLECADISVPIDWADESSDSATIAMAKMPAAGTSQGTLFVNPGGPGGSGVGFVEYAVTNDLANAYDIVGWDPRGVGDSTEVTCFDDKNKDKMLYDTFADPYLTEGWITELEAEAKDFAAACTKNTGDLLGHLDTVSTAHDLELMRALLTGDKPLDYLGYSYGTFIGATYAELFPKNVGKFVLDGAVDPQLSAFDQLLVQMTGFENGFRAYMTDCLAKSGCPFSGSLDQALTEAHDLIATTDALDLKSSDGRELDSATTGTGVAMALYSESSWPYLTELFAGIKAGDADPAFFLADYYNDRASDGSYSSNSVEVYEATTCVDNDFAADSASTLDRLQQIVQAAPTIGEFIALDDYAVLDVTCSTWPYPPAVQPTQYDAKGAAPILVIGTSNDPATPYAWAKSLAGQLDSGVLISVEGEGHTAYNGSNTCVNDVVDTYFIDGIVPKSDPRC